MSSPWHRRVRSFCNWLYFSRISVLGREHLPAHGPVLYLGLHRNGALDGFIYNSVLPRATFLISTQLRKNFFARLFFDGIAVVRSKDDGDRAVNADALRACLDLLLSGGELFIFPEGTSSLGPRHLPFKSGAAQLILEYCSRTSEPLTILPLGIHYECPGAFRSNVEVVIGRPIPLDVDPSSSPLSQLKSLKRRLQLGLEAVGINVETAEYQNTIETLAYAAGLGTSLSYFQCLKRFETALPSPIMTAWQEFQSTAATVPLARHQGVPLFPIRPPFLYWGAALLFSTLCGAAAVLNAPPLIAAICVGRRCADAPNVLSLWRVLAGVPSFLLWSAAVIFAAALLSAWGFIAAYLLLTWAGLKLCRTWKKVLVASWNSLRFPRVRAAALNFHQLLVREMTYGTPPTPSNPAA